MVEVRIQCNFNLQSLQIAGERAVGRAGEVPAPADAVFASISAGGYHSCGINVHGEVYCWGDNSSGQSDVPILE